MISSFSAFLQLFAALNLAYAGSKDFREALDDEILALDNTIIPLIRNEFKALKERFTAIDPTFLNSIETEFKTKKRVIFERQKLFVNFPIGFKGSFFIAGLACIFLLLLGGGEECELFFKTCTSDECVSKGQKIIPATLFSLNLYETVVIIWFFIKTFLIKKVKEKYSPFLILITVFCIIFVCLLFPNLYT